MDIIDLSWSKTKTGSDVKATVLLLGSNIFNNNADVIAEGILNIIKLDDVVGKSELNRMALEVHTMCIDPDMDDYFDGGYETFREFIKEDFDRNGDFMTGYTEALQRLGREGVFDGCT